MLYLENRASSVVSSEIVLTLHSTLFSEYNIKKVSCIFCIYTSYHIHVCYFNKNLHDLQIYKCVFPITTFALLIYRIPLA